MNKGLSVTFDRGALKDWFTPLHLSCDWWAAGEVIVGLSWSYGGCDSVWSVSRILTNPPRWIARLADRRWKR